ncbi:MAG: RIO1 family regulatory kinase/ATPase domain-containing protein [Candidatus Heimdallarchaeaceae archaeon]
MIDKDGSIKGDLKDLLPEITPALAIKEAIENKLITESYQIIGAGKEAFVIWGKDNLDRYVALKTYRIYRTSHKTAISNCRASPYEMVAAFVKREYWKAYAINKLKIPSPEPYEIYGISFTMELLGDESGPYPTLSEVGKQSIDEPVNVLEQCLEILHLLFHNRFVHGDFSAHNLLFDGEKVYVIDFLQTKRFALKDAVHEASPLIKLSNAYAILRKDLNAILSYFQRSFRLRVDFDEVLSYCLGNHNKKVERVLELNNELQTNK